VLRQSYLNTMRGLEGGLRVADIAVYELETCEPNESIADVRRRARRFDLDNIPVRDTGTIVGVVEDIKSYRTDVSAASVAAPLTEAMLVAGSRSLLGFLPTIADREYRLVIDDSGIRGVVTPSDVVQLPVRLLIFALLAHLEELMRANIRQKEPDDDMAVQHLVVRQRFSW
jgi:predicted transcriptional regulator